MPRTRLALRAGIAVRTLGYWESGERMPRIPELEAALTALGANENERMLAWSLLNVPRGMQQARKEVPQVQAHSTIWADTGDLLRAMRMRGGMTQEQMAAALGLQRSAVRRWEMSECLPSSENMERVFVLLKALPEEQHILRAGQMQMPGHKSSLTLEECAAEAAFLLPEAAGFQSPLMDLRALALKHHLRLLGVRSNAVLSLLAQVERDHCIWLNTQTRKKEAGVCLRKALSLMEEAGRPDSQWASILNLASMQFQHEIGQRGIQSRFLQHWLPGDAAPVTQVKLVCDAALYAVKERQSSAASGLLAKALRCVKSNAEAEEYWTLTAMRVRMYTESSEDALRWLLEYKPSSYFQTNYMLNWAEVLLRRGDKQAANRCLHTIERRGMLTAFPAMHRQFDRMTLRVS